MSDASHMWLPFSLVDVFDPPYGGNPLAVVTGAQALSAGKLSMIAGELHQAETTFLLPPTRPEADWRLRSFTGEGVEVFGAGHNSLGAWWWLAESGAVSLLPVGRVRVIQELGAELLPVVITSEGGVTSASRSGRSHLHSEGWSMTTRCSRPRCGSSRWTSVTAHPRRSSTPERRTCWCR